MPIGGVLVPLPNFSRDVNAVSRVFLTIDDALLKAGHSFRPVDSLRVGAKGREDVNEDRGTAYAQLHTLHIFRFFDRAFARS